MTEQRFSIGSEVTFTHRGRPQLAAKAPQPYSGTASGTTQQGRIVGAELVDYWRRHRGWHYFIKTEGFEVFDVHESQIGGVVEADCFAVPVQGE